MRRHQLCPITNGGLVAPLEDELSVFKMEPPVGTDINLNQKKSSIAAITQSYDCSARKTPFFAAPNHRQQQIGCQQ
ncbi:MAG: hypothetical protein IPN94_24240 [Sphingobacteriales bacterium]|nr:hypothetical protein [Sphingobacteriales bacterium]